MGRTNPTFRNLVRVTEERWQPYRRGLRYDDQPHFDTLFEQVRAHADAAGYLNHAEPFDAMLVSILLAHERRLAALEIEG